ncbi:MAG: HIT family protein, partial [Gammaproteobacteria bacterium]|nr:HIT family protein [Gammaproteobacteria bacterium]
DFDESEYLDIQRFIYNMSESMRSVFKPERVYILILGSKTANSHVHWHVVPLPVGVPLEEQQYYALMGENGIVEVTAEEQRDIADKLAAEISRRSSE